MPEKVKRTEEEIKLTEDLRVAMEAKSIFIMADTEKGMALARESEDHSFSGQEMMNYATAAVVFCLKEFPPFVRMKALENILQNLDCHFANLEEDENDD